jgi:hypothetical protein
MKEIILDNSLTPAVDYKFNNFNPEYAFNDCKGFKVVTTLESEIFHRNYLTYLELCWRKHYGIVISPTILWNLVLNNFAHQVNKTPEKFRKYFTESEEKQEIIVQQGGNLIDVNLIISEITSKIPSNIMENFFPKYTTDTEKSKIANYTAFLDMVSPYYNYGMLLCGIPKIKILGEKSDWLTMMYNLGAIVAQIPEFEEYVFKVTSIIADIIYENIDYSKFFTLERCGSGSQVMVSGWIINFFIEIPRIAYPENFISCVSKIDYKCYNDGNDYRLYAGLFTSIIEDGYLIPAFDNVYYKKI